MIIYPQEHIDGVGEWLKAQSSVTYDMPLLDKVDFSPELLLNKVTAAKFKRDVDTLDLHPIYSVLVTMAWNKNDDIFTKEEAWPARNSPEDKPFNFMHDQADIIGHITDSFVVDDSFAKIDDDAASMSIPDKFHIITGGVIYKIWEDPQKQQRMDKIIAEIKQGGKWFVSMECLFRGFDYGIIKANGESAIIARNESTSALTKYLRAYGGPGVYNGHKIGRVLKEITFSGKGLVSNPANPESVILNNFSSAYVNLGYVNNENINGGDSMSEVETLKAEIVELKNKLEAQKSSALLEQIANLNKSLEKSESAVAEYKTVATELETAKDKDKKFFEDKEKKDEKEKADLKAELDAVKADNEYMKKTIDEYKKAEKKTSRSNSIVKSGYSAEDAEVLVANTMNLNDGEFETLVSTFAAIAEKTKKEKEEAAIQPLTGPKPNFAEKDEDKADMGEDCESRVRVETVNPVDVITTATEKDHATLGVSISNEFTSLGKDVSQWYESSKNKGEKK